IRDFHVTGVQTCALPISRHFSGSDVMAAYNGVVAMRAAAVRATGAYDFVISPTSPVLPYAAELPSPTDDPENALAHIAFTVAYKIGRASCREREMSTAVD